MTAASSVAYKALTAFVDRGGLDENQRLIVMHGLEPGRSLLCAGPEQRLAREDLPQVALGMLLIHGGLDQEQMGIVQAGLAACDAGNHYTRDGAYALQARADAVGIRCYVRCWHPSKAGRSECGFFVIRWDDFTRVLEADIEAAARRAA